MNGFSLTAEQLNVLQAPLDAPVFLEGPAGSGKTTCAAVRVRRILESGVPGSQVLVLTPQRSLSRPYLDLFDAPDFPDGSPVDTLTIGGLAQRMVQLFWPVLAPVAGFERSNRPPQFLTQETAGYYMAQLVNPLLKKGYFDSLTIDPNRLFSQILDDLNKAALVGFPHTEIGERLTAAWIGDTSQRHVYAQAQECASLFRDFCLHNNLLDYSLQLELFYRHLWPAGLCREYLKNRYRHLVFDNLEEDVPLAHDLVCQWLPELDSAFLVYDTQAGYRLFLGADPISAYTLKATCRERFALTNSLVNSFALQDLEKRVAHVMDRRISDGYTPQPGVKIDDPCISARHTRYHPEMLDDAAAEIERLIYEEGIPPEEIAVLTPFLGDGLRFSLAYRLQKLQIPMRTLRPSHGLRDEPAVRCMLTLAMLAHPDWLPRPAREELQPCLMQAVEGLDLIRASLLVGRANKGSSELVPFGSLQPAVRERITNVLGIRYECLRSWIVACQAEPPVELDVFFSRLFGEVLSQPGFGFHQDFDAGSAAARLINSVREFRWTAGSHCDGAVLGAEYIATVRQGIIAAQFFNPGEIPDEPAVLLAPAFSFLMENRPVTYQFWLDCGSLSWWERLNQPLTHPYVLSRGWPAGKLWTDADEYAANQDTLFRLIVGLTRRCRKQIVACFSELSEGGFDQQGPLLHLLQRLLREGLAKPSHPVQALGQDIGDYV